MKKSLTLKETVELKDLLQFLPIKDLELRVYGERYTAIN